MKTLIKPYFIWGKKWGLKEYTLCTYLYYSFKVEYVKNSIIVRPCHAHNFGSCPNTRIPVGKQVRRVTRKEYFKTRNLLAETPNLIGHVKIKDDFTHCSRRNPKRRR